MNSAFRQPVRRADCSAYILLEVMLATAIFALVAVALAISLNKTIDAAVRLQRETDVIWNLDSKMAEVRVKRLVLGKEKSKADGNGIIYETEVKPLDLKNEKGQFMGGLYNIKITAYWKEDNRDEQMTSQMYVYQP